MPHAYYALLVLLLVCVMGGLSACGTTASTDRPEKTSFFMVSQGKASSLYRWVAGEVDYCKVTQHNLAALEFTGEIEYTADGCTVTVTAGGGGE